MRPLLPVPGGSLPQSPLSIGTWGRCLVYADTHYTDGQGHDKKQRWSEGCPSIAPPLSQPRMVPWPADLVGKVREGRCLALPQWPEEGWSFTCSEYAEQLLWTIDMEK